MILVHYNLGLTFVSLKSCLVGQEHSETIEQGLNKLPGERTKANGKIITLTVQYKHPSVYRSWFNFDALIMVVHTYSFPVL